ncbi:MAG: ParB/RepB/Spo0J family partition protein [Planctomycetota bacterium]
MSAQINVQGKDIPIELLMPLKKRKINFQRNRGYTRIKSSIQTAGLLDPLCVYPENGYYYILDGYLRYMILKELNVKLVPCQIQQNKEAYTYNMMVNSLSPVQQSRMIRKSLDTIDKKTIEAAFGVKSLDYQLATDILNHLHEDVITAVDQEIITRGSATELTYVNKKRQQQILKEMNRTKDYSISFARAMVIKTPAEMRCKNRKRKMPWTDNLEKKQQLTEKLKETEERYDFYSLLYRQYSTDLIMLCTYTRQLITNENIRTHLEVHFPELLERFEKIIFETEDKQV